VLLGTLDSVFAKDGLNLELIHQLDLPDVLLSKLESMVLGQDLKLVRQFMGAYFVDFEQVDRL